MTPAEIASLKEKVAKLPWYHTIDLGNGVVTPGQDNSPKKLKRLCFPESFAGKTVLDMGTWNGFFSYEAERRGAKRVLATDKFVWQTPGHREAFHLAKAALNSKIEEMEIDVFDISRETVGEFDIVFFMGVLYHMRHPVLSLEKLAGVTREMAIIETVVDMLGHKRPAMAYYETNELYGDYSNWVGPNPAAVCAMLRTAGFKRVEIVAGTRSFLFRLGRAIYLKKNGLDTFMSALRTDRIVAHAFK